jgi:hypothetical protein
MIQTSLNPRGSWWRAARWTIDVLEIEVAHWKKNPGTIVGAPTGKLYNRIAFSVWLRRCEDTPRVMTDYKKQAPVPTGLFQRLSDDGI